MSIRMRAGVSARLGFALEDLCREILAVNGWQVESSDSFSDTGIDIIATDPTRNDRIAFEVKYTRNPMYPTSALRISSERLIESANAEGIDKAVLIVAADIKPEIKERVENQYKIQILNLDDLLSLASIDLELLGRLVKLREIDLSERNLDSNIKSIIQPTIIKSSSDTSSSHENEKIGINFIDVLKAIPLGKEGCYKFEDTVSEILQYLFDGDLTGWHQQKRTTDDLHRYDLICRVIDNSTVWKFISLNLDSRYVLFEFKNYKDKIGQSQVYSTEKYLYEKAKRKVCFLISRKGPSKNAVVACQGAMREHGKLILNLDEDMLIDLINSKISGDDPNELLFEKVDKFLMELPR
ncbi:restriction endonuclease [Neptuniibacter sp. QD34_54]|uniref:restriction endonuclease n=1 Tax=Neptuniibacter sp. QD34_54 TaxID=3398208 RepID=UPI0039F5D793